jgi:hypothetical protein
MEQSGVWDRTHVILTSDHSWSASKLADGSRDPRVPVLIKLAGRQPRVSDAKPFNTMAIADVVPQLLRAGAATPDDLGRWLHGSAASALTPLAR